MFPCPNHRYPIKGFLRIRPCEDRAGKPKAGTGGRGSWECGDGPGRQWTPRPQEASSKGEPQHPCTSLQVHHNFHGDRKTRESVPPTGQPGQGHWECRAQARPEKVLGLSSSHPGATLPREDQQTSWSRVFLALGRVFSYSLSGASFMVSHCCRPGLACVIRALGTEPPCLTPKRVSQRSLSLPWYQGWWSSQIWLGSERRNWSFSNQESGKL